MSLLHQLDPHYVRCIKPNPANKPLDLQDGYTLHQLRCGGVMEAVRISCTGYPFRRTFADFLDAFWQLYPPGRAATSSGVAAAAAAACRQLLTLAGMQEGKDYQIGSTKVFLKAHQSAQLTRLHLQALAAAATKIQAGWRCYKAQQVYVKQRKAIIAIQAGTRSMFARQRAAAIRRSNAATFLQAAWRGCAARAAYQQRQLAAFVLQALLRATAAKAVYRQALHERCSAAAVAMQSAWRAAAVRQHCLQLQQQGLTLQSAWRGAAVRQQYRQALQQYSAAVALQSAWRQYKRSKSAYRQDAAAKAAAIVIQTIWREREQHNSKVRRLQAAVWQYTAVHKAAMVLQAAWRVRTAQQQLHKLQEAARRARFKQQMQMFEQQYGAQAAAGSSSSLNWCGSDGGSADSASRRATLNGAAAGGAAQLQLPGVMPPPQRAAYGVGFAGLTPRSPSPTDQSSNASPPGSAMTQSKVKWRPLAPPLPTAYGISYSGINGDINPISPGQHLNQDEPAKPRSFKLFTPPPAAAYGVSYQGSRHNSTSGVADEGSSSSMRARLLEPAPPAAYGIGFIGLPPRSAVSTNGADSQLFSRTRSFGKSSSPTSSYYRSPSSGGSSAGLGSRLALGLRKLGSGKGLRNGDESPEDEQPLLEVVKADDPALLPPEDRLFVRLGGLVGEKGKVASLVLGWKRKVAAEQVKADII
eukprot:GHRR01009392.1.p1 GENE.GHRR01009392.1~~GHRR01009392.1.p1  ORF type:complete len:696 (+),score=311.73 GHRR01009392.1:1091-3178(+)